MKRILIIFTTLFFSASQAAEMKQACIKYQLPDSSWTQNKNLTIPIFTGSEIKNRLKKTLGAYDLGVYKDFLKSNQYFTFIPFANGKITIVRLEKYVSGQKLLLTEGTDDIGRKWLFTETTSDICP